MSPSDAPPGDAPDESRAAEAASFPIVGIGASAGGLEALASFVHAIELDSMAFVVVQHLAPDRESLLTQILARSSEIPVVEITDGLRVTPNRVHVSPPNADVAILHGVLHLMSPSSPMPIDKFFRSLAEDQGRRAVGVVLSGMGRDGTQGLLEIKARGGLAFAQDPASAKFNSMPSSAFQSGAVDRVLPPEAIAAELMKISKHPYVARQDTPTPTPARDDTLDKLFVLIRTAYGNDLSLYKQTTIVRRVERRMALRQMEKPADYVKYVQEHPEELAGLYGDILIGVTSFFRDVEPFAVIRQVVLPRILELKAPGAAIRLWVPACASGEEAYSLGICLLEGLDRMGRNHRLQIFATDIDENAIERARRGVYPPNIEADVSKERLQQFFVKDGDNYQVTRRLRDVVVFSPQNVADDSPFSRIDLVSCRNLLIYLQPALQRKVLRLFHYALGPGGFLVLGTSETVGDCADLFSPIDRQSKIHIKKNLPAVSPREPTATVDPTRGTPPAKAERERRSGPTAQQIADRKLLERYGPPSVLVDENLNILQFRGDTGPYLAPASGAPALNLLKLLRPELHVEVRRVTQAVLRSGAPGRGGPVRLARDAEPARSVSVEVLPVHESDTSSRCLLLIFEDGAREETSSSPSFQAMGVDDREALVRDLERDLTATKEYLQTTIEELETSNEELKSTNEELQATNEELQSINEEHETSKEELQSTNEELGTLNDELQHRVTDLKRANSDLDNLLLSVLDPVLFVDDDMRLRRMSDSAQRLLQLEQNDFGRSLAQLKGLFAESDIEEAVRTTRSRLVVTSEQVRISDRWHDMRVVPYRSPGGVLDGAIVWLRDVDAERRRQFLVLDVEAYADKVLAAIPHSLAVLDKELRVLWINEPFCETFKVDTRATVGNLFTNLGSGQWAHPKLRQAIDGAFATGQTFRDFRIEHDFEAIGHRAFSVSGSTVSGVGTSDRVLILTIVVRDDGGPSEGGP